MAERNGPARIEERGTFIVGFPRNLGGPVVSVDEIRFEDCGEQLQDHSRSGLRLRERSPRRSDGTVEKVGLIPYTANYASGPALTDAL